MLTNARGPCAQITVFPFMFWNVDPAIARRVVYVWVMVMCVGQRPPSLTPPRLRCDAGSPACTLGCWSGTPGKR